MQNLSIDSLCDHFSRGFVIGLGKSGVSAAKVLTRLGIKVTAFERQTKESFSTSSLFNEEVQQLVEQGMRIHYEKTLYSDISYGSDAIAIVSPGVAWDSPLLEDLRLRGVTVIGELEFGVSLLKMKTIMVTGSNGKSTTVSTIAALLKGLGIAHELLGNIGIPPSQRLCELLSSGRRPLPNSIAIIEASSYQLEATSFFCPDVAVFLNFSENHLERHGSVDEYFRAKSIPFLRQDELQCAILSGDDPRISSLAGEVKSHVRFFSSMAPQEKMARSQGALVKFDSKSGVDTIELYPDSGAISVPLQSFPLHGLHNRLNLAAALLAVDAIGVPLRRDILERTSFRGLEHRMEYLGVVKNAHWYNDAKSTTPASTAAGYRSICEMADFSKVFLMLGGQAKRTSWESLHQVISEYREKTHLVIFGESRDDICARLEMLDVPMSVFKTMKEALVDGVSSLIAPTTAINTIILCSPACASFDEFTDFYQRGETFKAFFREIKESDSTKRDKNSRPSAL